MKPETPPFTHHRSGLITQEFTVWCKKCDNLESFPLVKTRDEASVQALRRGWIINALGWLCPYCAWTWRIPSE